MVVVHEHYLGANLAHLVYRGSLHSRASPNWHEYRSLYHSVWRSDRASSGESVSGVEGEGKIWKSSHKKSESRNMKWIIGEKWENGS